MHVICVCIYIYTYICMYLCMHVCIGPQLPQSVENCRAPAIAMGCVCWLRSCGA